MVKKQELTEIWQKISEVKRAADSIHQTHRKGKKEGVTVEQSAYEDDQKTIKNHIAELVNQLNGIAEDVDKLELPNGETVELPEEALDKNKEKPVPPKPESND